MNQWYVVYLEMDCKVSSFMLDLNTLKIENLQKYFTDDSMIWIPPAKEIYGSRRILALFRAIFRRYEKIEWRALEIFDLGKGRYFYETISVGNMKGMGTYENRICTIVEFSQCGKIKSLSDYFKDTACFH